MKLNESWLYLRKVGFLCWSGYDVSVLNVCTLLLYLGTFSKEVPHVFAKMIIYTTIDEASSRPTVGSYRNSLGTYINSIILTYVYAYCT